jgi:pimeloyl-ACP methyl ester carboxylesterase
MKFLKWSLLISIIVISAAGAFLFEGGIPTAAVDAKYSNQASQFVTLDNGSRIHYRDQGRAEGYAIILIHGAMASLHTWEPWVAILGQQYRVITLDLPPHGLTGSVPSGEYGGSAFTTAIDAVAAITGVKRFVLGGNSMGGGATWRYTLANPEKVSAMLLIDSEPPAHWESAKVADDNAKDSPIGFSLLRQRWFRAIAAYIDPAPLVSQGLRSAYNNSPVVNQQLIDRYYELIMREGTRSAIVDRMRAYSDGANESPDLRQLKQPALIMWGAQDALIPVSVVEQFEQALPNTRTVIYPDLGHIPMEEDPDRSAQDVIRFLQTAL